MRVSGSVLCSVVAAVWLAVHLPFLAPSLEDIDSINFALGLREFDVARHQPHPPGSPVYIALGRISLAAIPSLPAVRAEALALAIWSALAGAIAILAAYRVFAGLDRAATSVSPDERSTAIAVWSIVLLAVSPLFWISGLRPMSDLPGLAVALTAQAAILASRRVPSLAIAGALLAGLAAGIRVQTIWLTVPLLLVMLVPLVRAGGWRPAAASAAALGAGVLAWMIPLLVTSGGLDAYIRALGAQAGEDFAWVDMVAANPSPRRVAFALYETFVLPWGAIPLAVVVLVAAAAGIATAMVKAPRQLLLASVAFGPYAIFHVLFQETPHVRYALSIVPAVAWLAARGVAGAGRLGPVLMGALSIAAAWVAVPGMLAYAREPHPAFRAISDMSAAASTERPGAVFSHYAVRRPLQAASSEELPFVEPPRTNEWAALVEYWRSGKTAPVWFLADPRRTDLAIVDPRSRENVRRYAWAAAGRLELNGTRPLGVDWYRLSSPGWFAGAGWSLTPELGGVTRLEGTGVDRRPVEAFVRRRPEAMVGIVGAYHLGTAGDGAVTFTMELDGAPLDEWTLDPSTGPNVLRTFRIPAMAPGGEGGYATLTIRARRAAGDGATPPVAIRQFDVQPEGGLVVAFDAGWHEAEFDNATGVSWRWSSGDSVLRVVPPQPVRLTLRGESPLKYFDDPPTVQVVAGGRTIATTRPADNFEWTVTVAGEDVRVSDGRISIQTAPVYRPGDVEGTADPRQLGLRLFDIVVSPVSP